MTRHSLQSNSMSRSDDRGSAGTISAVRKRDGRVVSFDQAKITNAIFKAAHVVGGEDKLLAEELSGVVALFLKKQFDGDVPGIEDIQDMVEKVLIETGHAKTAKAYILYREDRRKQRDILKVRKHTTEGRSSTDLSLLVDAGGGDQVYQWDKAKIAKALTTEARLDEEVSWDVASAVEGKIIKSGIERLSTDLIRALVDNELFERGFTQKL